MKIGILTHHYINNFGAFLQGYALQKAVRELCPDDEVYIINYINNRHFIINTCGWFRFYRSYENMRIWCEKIHLPMIFAKARKNYLILTKRCRDAKHIDKLKFGCIIIGSDEVWNYRDKKSNDPIKFGNGLNTKNLIAYAPSVGQAIANDIPTYVIDGIKKFKAVSARDDLTEQLAGKIRGEKIERVVDPTFLTELPDEPVEGIKKPYILFYYCDGLPGIEKNKIFEYAEQNGYNVYGAGEGDKHYSSATVDLTPFQWVWMFRNANHVLTGTFHGAVFSILNNRKFACFLKNPSRIKKVGSLLKEFGLEDHQCEGTAENLLSTMRKNVDYTTVKQIIENKKIKSQEFLKRNIALK